MSQNGKSSFLNLLFNLIIPSLILTKLSSPSLLGPILSLVAALLFPISYGVLEFVRSKKVNFFSALGLFSVLVTGGIGIFEIDPEWLAIKEAAVPLIIGVVIFASSYTRYPLVKLFFNQIIDFNLIREKLASSEEKQWFEARFYFGSILLAGTFFISAVLNYTLAKRIVVSPAGTEAFNKELGLMNVLSFPVIALPMTIMLMVVMWYILHQPLKKAGITWETILESKLPSS